MDLSGLKPVSSNIDFPKEEEKILEFWRQIHVFQQQLKLSKDRPKYTFYDGPPFATGLPHYGHILAGTIKDVVTRYVTFHISMVLFIGFPQLSETKLSET